MVCMDSFSGMSRALQNVLSWMTEFMRGLAPAYFLTVSVSAGTTSAAVFYERGAFACLAGAEPSSWHVASGSRNVCFVIAY